MDGVIRWVDQDFIAREHAKLGIEAEILKAVQESIPASLWEASTIGRASHHEIPAAIRAGVASVYGSYVADEHARIRNAAQRRNEDLLAAVERLRTRYAIGVVSNATAGLEEDLVRMELDDAFDTVVISAHVGMAKPDPGIYLEAARRVNSAPAQCVFIDDKQSNVNGAVAVGMRGYVYTGMPDLISDLQAAGIAV